MWMSALLLAGALLGCRAALDEEIGSLKEQLRVMSAGMMAITTKHTIEYAALKKELDNIRQEAKSQPSGNHRRNEQLTLEWARAALGELRGEMREVEASANASQWRRERRVLRNDVAAAAAEAAGAARRLAQAEARDSAHAARLQEALLEVKQARDLAAAAKRSCFSVKNELKLVQLEWKMSFKTLNRQSQHINNEVSENTIEQETPKGDSNQHRTRHMRLMRKQIQVLEKSHRKLMTTQDNMNDHIMDLQARVETATAVDSTTNINTIMRITREQQRHEDAIQNITAEVGNFNKLHISVLELLENVENLENKVDKAIPDFQKEISKLDVDVAQVNSQSAYLKEDQKNIRQSVKAIAVGVSNMVDKVNGDHTILQKINVTVEHLDNQSKQHFYRLADHISKTEANQARNYTTESEDVTELIGELQELKTVQEEFEDIISHLPANCDSVKGPAGHYLIAPGPGAPVQTLCEDSWTLVQARHNGSVDFNRNFKEYAAGFGSPSGEFWIGNEALHRLTVENCSSLRIEMKDIYGKSWLADYSDFRVGSALTGYRLDADGYSGNASDALDYQNRMEFSTIDKDRDISNTHCAANYEGGWWFSHCQHANLNGKYTLGLTWFDGAHNEWIAVTSSRIILRNRPNCTST